MKFLAGGQSLGPMLNLRLVQPDLLVDITAIAELKQVEETADGITIGSCITHADIEDGRVPDVTRGALRTVAAGIAYRAVRNRGPSAGASSMPIPPRTGFRLSPRLAHRPSLAAARGRGEFPSIHSCSACSRAA